MFGWRKRGGILTGVSIMHEYEEKPTQVVITQEQLVDLLMNLARREDIARLDKKIDDLETRMDRQFQNVDRQFQNIDRQFQNIDRQFQNVDRKFLSIDQQFQKIDSRFTWIITTVITCAIGLAGLILQMH
jgi:predicted  nucleic acid-binding Zn-ribbon protein